MFQDGAIDGAVEPRGVIVDQVRFRSFAVVHSWSAGGGSPGRNVKLFRLASRRFARHARNRRIQLDFIQRVAISFKKTDLLPADAEDLVTIGRLQNADERFEVETVRHDRELRDRALKSICAEETGRTEDSESI